MGKLKSRTNITQIESLGKEYNLDFLYGKSKEFDIAFKEGPTASEKFIRKLIVMLKYLNLENCTLCTKIVFKT